MSVFPASTAAALKPHLERWLRRPLRPEAAPIRLLQRRIYVLPSAAGLAFAAALLVMLLASINYELSLGFALTFLLGGVGLASMVHAFRNLLHLEIRPLRSEPVFCGEPARFALLLENGREAARPALCLATAESAAMADVPAGDSTEAVVERPTTRRGWLPLGRVTVETRYPLGLVRAWSTVHPDLRCLVYPAPETDPPPLPLDGGTRDGNLRRAAGEDDFAGLRQHQRADSPRHIAWKAFARGGPLLVKQFSGSAGGEVALDWHALPPALDEEARLARLAAWLLAAHGAGREFSLRMDDASLPRGGGARHLHEALKLLALHGRRNHEG
ncbi:DUF58 domain-containing protein [Pseudothauera rhizosphaerae]|uniref:DUF58 domain-containing protein n=1 Tax=Pseudothauera rhizosphaerae TaxID=2565932 RepID=A0A4S4B025_9RHOO|nr:DUF58 domain-containing protein [Pseudothauera rhizosphaerae]THF64215.1 DUF58 domain-containing protein [Pseudothauera rhizosphaerae]